MEAPGHVPSVPSPKSGTGWVMSAVWRMATVRRTTGRPHLRYKDVCIRDMKAVDIDTKSWEGLAADLTKWRSALKQTSRPGKTN